MAAPHTKTKNGGAKRGAGRPKGSRNALTIEKERLAAEIARKTVMDARQQGKKLAKEILREGMEHAMGLAGKYQEQGVAPNPAAFKEWLNFAMSCARSLAPYESPTFSAIAVVPPAELMTSQLPANDDKVITIDDPAALQRVYKNIMGGR